MDISDKCMNIHEYTKGIFLEFIGEPFPINLNQITDRSVNYILLSLSIMLD